jgi:hypothetical protein
MFWKISKLYLSLYILPRGINFEGAVNTVRDFNFKEYIFGHIVSNKIDRISRILKKTSTVLYVYKNVQDHTSTIAVTIKKISLAGGWKHYLIVLFNLTELYLYIIFPTVWILRKKHNHSKCLLAKKCFCWNC